MRDDHGCLCEEILISEHLKAISHRSIPDLRDEQADGKNIPVTGWLPIVATCVDAWPRAGTTCRQEPRINIQAAGEGMLALFQVAEEVGEVDDTSHVGFVELDKVGNLEGLLFHPGKRSREVSIPNSDDGRLTREER